MFCTNCGKELSDEITECEYCGEVLDVEGISNESAPVVNHMAKEKPLRTGYFFIMQLILLVPIVNILVPLVLSFKKGVNRNIKSYSRSILIWYLIVLFSIIAMLIYMLLVRYPVNPYYWVSDFKNLIFGFEL